MTQSLDWTTVSDDPNHPQARAAVRDWLKTAQRIHTDCDLLGHIERLVEGRRVLDIGVVEHSLHYMNRPDWRHGRICQKAAYCLGLDILEPLVKELAGRGFNVRCVDATSDLDLGERFDVAFIGDVIEHVPNASQLLKFAARHLAPGGRLFVTTPNPFSRKFVRQFKREGVMVVNLDHVAWVTPTMAMELARRVGIRLVAYHLVKPFSAFGLAMKRLIGWRLEPAEYSFPDYLYEFASDD